MRVKTNKNETTKLLNLIKDAMLDKKAEDIVIMDLNKVENAITRYFIIGTASSNVHASSLSSFIEKHIHENNKEKPWHKEGFENSEWILLDYVDVVVHIFQPETREFYKLEQLWADAEVSGINN